jgi:hypothetical protein
MVQSQPGQIVRKTLSQKTKTKTKKKHRIKGLAEWLRVKVLCSSPTTTKNKVPFDTRS